MRRSALPLSEQLAVAGVALPEGERWLSANLNYYSVASMAAGATAQQLRGGAGVDLGGAVLRDLPLPAGLPSPRPYDLMLTLWEGSGGASGALRYHPERLSEETAAAIVAALAEVLTAARECPDRAVADWVRDGR